MRTTFWVALVVAAGGCFSKPQNNTGRDAGGGDAIDATDASLIDAPPSVSIAPATLAAGDHHACAINATSRLYCWGDNSSGQLGDTPLVASGTPIDPQPTLLGSWSAVAAGARHTCGIHAAQIVCWGNNSNNQAGGSSTVNTLALPGGVAPVKVFAGQDASCATDAMNRVYCWGKYDQAQPGVTTPTEILSGTVSGPWEKVVPGSVHSCAIRRDFSVSCWGQNTHLQLANTGGSVAPTAATPIAGHAFIDVSVSAYATCGVTAGNELQCFGTGINGHIGPYTGADTAVAVEVDDGFAWTRIALGPDHACGIAGGKVRCYGINSSGAMGNGFTPHRVPAAVTLPTQADAVDIVSGTEFSCARDTTGAVSCWGTNRTGELGNTEIASTRQPTSVPLGLSSSDVVAQIVVGDGHSCALIRPAGLGPSTVKCWGDNRSRQVDGGAMFAETPRPSAMDLMSISAGGLHTCGVMTGGNSVECWGNNQSMQLGRSNMTNGTHSVLKPAAGPWTKVGAGSTATCAVASNELHCWGTVPAIAGTVSQLPGRVSDLAHRWSDVVLGSGFAAGIVDDLEIGGFGRGCPYGYAADFAAVSPASVGTIGDLTSGPLPYQLAAAQSQGDHTCVHLMPASGPPAIVRCWGSNARHQIDTNPATGCYTATLVQPPASAAWVLPAIGTISIAGSHACAIAELGGASTDPRVFCWGADDTRMLGFGPNNGGTPSQVNDLVVSKVATGNSHTCAIGKAAAASQDSVYCWGENRYGEVGNGARFRDTPVAVALP